MTFADSGNNLEASDNEVMDVIWQHHGEDLILCKNLLADYLRGLALIKGFAKTEENILQYAWLLLTIRSFNTLKSAYALLQQGYYDQSVILIRAVEEDWLIATDLENYPKTLQALLCDKGQLGRGKLAYSEMAKRISNEFYEKTWKRNYGFMSTIAHPRERAMRILVDPDSKTLRLGGQYDWTLFAGMCHALLLSVMKMMNFVAKVLAEKAEPWQKETIHDIKAARDWCEKLEAKVKER